MQQGELVADVYDTSKFLVCADCLVSQNQLSGFMADLRLCNEFAFRIPLSFLERFGMALHRLLVAFLSADVQARDTNSTPG